ncbi:MAG: hypothetical protein NE334_11735 [Lentisphaeraceae bacterium]|nr:hypothetical protein [Lentisphaeraceae bacterium]
MNHNYIIKDLKTAHIWAEGVREIKEDYEKNRNPHPIKVQYKYKHWSIKYESGYFHGYKSMTGETLSGAGPYTKFKASITSKEKFNLELGTENFVTRTLKKFGHNDILTEDAAFDEEFFIKSNNKNIAKDLLASDQLRQSLQALPTAPNIYTKGRKTRKKLFIYWRDGDIIDDIDLLKDLFKLFCLMLDQLKKIKVID